MRPIKFRAWDKKYTIMLEPEAFNRNDIWIGGDGSVYEIEEWSGYSGGGKIENNVSDQYIIMQYAGLVDRNHTEIYEGDILRSDIYETIGNNYVVDDLIHFHYLIIDLALHMDDVEIIGNIYQNKELIS